MQLPQIYVRRTVSLVLLLGLLMLFEFSLGIPIISALVQKDAENPAVNGTRRYVPGVPLRSSSEAVLMNVSG